jgi:hypothetical protein
MDEFEENLEGINTEGNDEGSTIVEITTGDGNSEVENPTKTGVANSGTNTSESGGTTNEDGKTTDTSGTGSGTSGTSEGGSIGNEGSGGLSSKVTSNIHATIKVNTQYNITGAKIKIGYGNYTSGLTNILNEDDGDDGYCCIYDSTSSPAIGSYDKNTGVMVVTGSFNYDLQIENNTYYYVFFYFATNSSNTFKINNNCLKLKGDQLKGLNSARSITTDDIKNSITYNNFGSWSNHETEQNVTQN